MLPTRVVANTAEIIKSVAIGADDGCSGDWAFYDTAVWYEIGSPGTGATYDAWFRFTNINIPAGATVLQARLETVHGSWDNGTHLKIYAEKAANPSAPISTVDHTGRIRTNTGVEWISNGSDWEWHNSPNFASVIQELVGTYDYSGGGNAIQILVDDDGSDDGDEHTGSTLEDGYAPVLYIKYTP